MEQISYFKENPRHTDSNFYPYHTIRDYNRRFSTAIDFSELEVVLTHCSDVIQQMAWKYHDISNTIHVPPPNLLSQLICHILQDQHDKTQLSEHYVDKALGLAQSAVNLQIDWVTSRVLHPQIQWQHQNQKIPDKLSSHINYLMMIGMDLDYTITRNQRLIRTITDVSELEITAQIANIKMYFLGKFVILMYDDNKYYLFPSYIIPLFIAKMIELGTCLLANTQQRRSDLPTFLKLINQFLIWMESVIQHYGNNGYAMLKSLDGLGHGMLTSRLDSSHSTFLLDNVKRDLIKDFSSYDVKRILNILEKLECFDIPNITGLAKLYGYPIIQTEKGLKTLYDRTHKNIVITGEAVKRVINMGKLLFINAYYKKHKRYPPLTFTASVPKQLLRLLLSNRPLNDQNKTSERIPFGPSNFDGIQLEKCEVFDWYDRFYPLLKDKAAASPRSRVVEAFESQKFLPGSKRVLLDFIRDDSVLTEWRRFRKQFERNPKLVQDQFVIKLTTKELEQKTIGRLFGQSPILERHRRIVGESNIATLMTMYNSDQSMLIDEHDKQKRMTFLSRASNYLKDYETIIIGVDAEAWNNYFRSTLVDKFGAEIFDRIFGINFFCNTMAVFNQGLIYHRDAANNIVWWNGQEGGIEGLAQKIWTWIYTVIARLVLHLSGLTGFMMVNGDDMRLIVLVPKSQYPTKEKIEEFQSNLLTELRDLFHIYGITMKVDETNMTRSLLCFGRVYTHDGIGLPGQTKKLIKAGGLTDIGFPSLTDVIGSIMANAHSACSLSYQITPNITLAYTIVLMYLHNNKFLSLTPVLGSSIPVASLRETVLLLSTPNMLGGLDTLMLPQFIMQGESDPLPLYIDWLNYLWKTDRQYQSIIKRILSIELSTILPKQLLITDIFSLPLNRHPRPLSVIRSYVRRKLPRYCRNVELTKLLNFDQQNRSQLVNCLWSMEPFNPRIASYLYTISPLGIIDSIVQKFESAPTISTVMFSRNPDRTGKLYAMINKVDRTLIGSTIRRIYQGEIIHRGTLLRFSQLIANHECPTHIAHQMRIFAWRRTDLVDDTIPSVIHQMMITVPNSYDPLTTYDLHDARLNHFSGRTEKLNYSENNKGILAPLICAPYFSHTTGLRLGARITDLKGSEPLIIMLKKLTEAQALLADQGHAFVEWANWCSMCLFGSSVAEFCPSLVSKLGGTVGHRLPSRDFERTVYINTVPARSGRCKTTLDTIAEQNNIMAKNRKHNYSAMTCWFRFTLTLDVENDLLSNGYQSTSWGILIACRDKDNLVLNTCLCHEVVSDRDYTMDSPSLHIVPKILRLMNGCLLTKLPLEMSVMIDQYRENFYQLWAEGYEHINWINDGVLEDKYIVASKTASVIISSLIHPTVELKIKAQTTVEDVMEFHSIIGRNKEFENVSARDFMYIDMDHLADAFIRACVSCVLDHFSPILMSSSYQIHLILNAGCFLPLCNKLAIKRQHGRFISSINKLFVLFNIPPITLSFELISNPVSLAKALSRTLTDMVYMSIVLGTSLPSSINVYIPAYETFESIKKIFLSQIWRFIITAVISLKDHIRFPIPQKFGTFDNMRSTVRLMYLCCCIMMTRIYASMDYHLTNDVFREISIDYYTWCETPIQDIITWDPLVPIISTFTLSPDLQGRLDTIIHDICDRTFIHKIPLKITLIRLPYKTCINICKEYFNTQDSLSRPEQHELIDIRDVTIDKEAIVCGTAPLDADLQFTKSKIELPFCRVPHEERQIIDVASFKRIFMLSTGALNKYIEIIEKIRGIWSWREMTSSGLATADGSGGVAALLTRFLKNSKVIFNTLVMERDDITANTDCVDQLHLTGSEMTRLLAAQNSSSPNDLSLMDTIDFLSNLTNHENLSKYCIITCDAEAPEIEVNIPAQRMIINLIYLINQSCSIGGVAILKCFLSESVQVFLLYCYLLSSFNQVGILKPTTSHIESGEIFLVGVNKTREWEKALLDEYVLSPKYTTESYNLYINKLKQIAQQREDKSWLNIKIKSCVESDSCFSNKSIKLFSDWRVTWYSVTGQLRFIPITWYQNGSLICEPDTIEEELSKLCLHIKTNSFSRLTNKSFFQSIGGLCVLKAWVDDKTFDEANIYIKEKKVILYTRLGLIDDHIKQCRFIRTGARLMSSFLGSDFMLANEER